MHEIYLITNKINGKVYIGQTSQTLRDRWTQHCDPTSNCRHLRSAISKYGRDSFSMERLGRVDTQEEATNLEDIWIILLDSRNREYGYNISKAGPGAKGYTHSEEGKAAIGRAHRGKIISEETREKLRQANLGKKHGDSCKKKLSALTGEKANHFNSSIPTPELVFLYNSGLSCRAIGKQMGVSYNLVVRRLKKEGVDIRPNRQQDRKNRLTKQGKDSLVSPPLDEVVRLYESGMTAKQVGDVFQMGGSGITYLLRTSGYVLRPKFSAPFKKETDLGPDLGTEQTSGLSFAPPDAESSLLLQCTSS